MPCIRPKLLNEKPRLSYMARPAVQLPETPSVNMKDNNSIVFLPGYNQNLPKRHRELIKSAALSHAGSAAHRRRRKQRKDDPSVNDTPPSNKPPRDRNLVALIELNKRSALKPWHGNSDPFDVAGVLYLSPRISELLLFVRSHYLPAPFAAPPHIGAATLTPWIEDHVKAGFQNILDALQEPSCAQAYVYSASVGMARVTSGDRDLGTEKLRMKGRALDALRAQFLENVQDTTTILRSSEYLFSAAVMDCDAMEAKMHGAVVRDMLWARALRDGFCSVNSSFLIRIMFKDAMLSEASNTPTIFDPVVWEPVVAASIAPTEDMLPELVPVFEEPFDDFLANGDWIAIFSDTRRALWAYRRPWVIYSGYAGQYWAYSRLVLLQCKAINHYVKLLGQESSSPTMRQELEDSPPPMTKFLSQQVESCLALAVLLFASLFRCKLDQLFYYNTKQLFHQLQSALEKSLDSLCTADIDSSTPDDGLKPLHNALLWSLFIGAVVENQSSRTIDQTTYMTNELHRHVRRMDLGSWAAVEQILSKFVYSIQLLHPRDAERERLLGPFKDEDPCRGSSTPLDEALEHAWMCHEANFKTYMNRTESLRATMLRSSTDRR